MKHCVFSGKPKFRCREKLARVRDGSRHRHFRVESISNGAVIGSKASRWLFFLCWRCALLVCMCCGTLCTGTAAWQRVVLRSCVAILIVLHITGPRSQWNCYIMDAIWMLWFARNSVLFHVNGGPVAEKSWLPCTTVADIAALKSNLSRTALALELKLPADFSLLTLCFASLHVLRCFVHWNCCMTASCFQVMCCDSDCVLQLGLCGSQWNGCVKASGCCGCVQNTIAFCGWESKIAL